MHFNTYGGLAADLAAELASLAAAPQPATAAAVAELLQRHEFPRPRLSPDDVHALLSWGERLAPVFGEQDLARQTALVNDALARAAARPYVSTHDGQPPHLHYADESDPLVVRVRAQTAAGLAFVLCTHGGHRLGRCHRPGCARAFVDVSRGGRRTFCSVRCANRVNVARHRERSRSRSRSGT